MPVATPEQYKKMLETIFNFLQSSMVCKKLEESYYNFVKIKQREEKNHQKQNKF